MPKKWKQNNIFHDSSLVPDIGNRTSELNAKANNLWFGGDVLDLLCSKSFEESNTDDKLCAMLRDAAASGSRRWSGSNP